MEVRCAPTRAAPFTRRSMLTRKVTPKRLAISWASVIILIDRSRRQGSVATMSSVARVRALMGLKHRLPHSLSQISLRMSPSTGASNPPCSSALAKRTQRSDTLPMGSPRANLRP
jgi:hypothetical protein